MKKESHTLTLITPCFCAGANQQKAEIRPSSIRGEWRWWFRCLGGTKEEENAIFGQASGNNSETNSSIRILVSDIKLSTNFHIPTFKKLDDPGNYLHYYLTVPNEVENKPGRMLKQDGFINKTAQLPKESSFLLTIIRTRQFDKEITKKVDLSLQCLLHFGSIGYRKTRGFGSWKCDNPLTLQEINSLLEEISKNQFSYDLASNFVTDASQLLNSIEAKLKGNKKTQSGLRLTHKATDATPLGFSDVKGKRQTSAVLFRPIAYLDKNNNYQYKLLILQAPNLILGETSSKIRIIPTQK